MSATQSIPDTSFGFTQSELIILRQQQQVAQQDRNTRSTMPDRGRGTSRQSQPSSRAASAASSQSVQGRITLDGPSLARLYTALDSLYRSITGRIQQLEDATEASVEARTRGAQTTAAEADEEIRKMKRILQEIDRLEEKCEDVKKVRDTIKRLRTRVDQAGDRMDRLTSRPSTHSARSDPRRR